MLKQIFLLMSILGGVWLQQTPSPKGTTRKPSPESPSMLKMIQFLEAEGYDNRQKPHWHTADNRTVVEVLMILNSITSIDEIKMDLDLDMFVMRQWRDSRLVNITETPPDKNILVFGEMEDRLWVPNFYFVNSKTARYHNVTTLNQETYIEVSTGTVYMNVRVTVKVRCPMQLWNFPMDNQTCELNIQSDVHDGEVVYKWVDVDPVSVNSDVTLPKFNLLRLPEPEECMSTRRQNLAVGDKARYSCLKLNIHIVRQFGYYLIQIYIPSICLVMMSWVSFWLTVESTPARASVGVITVLTITTMSGGASQTSPKVSYLKALDIWFLTITGFVFSAFFEFAIVNTVYRTTRKKKLRNLQKRRQKLADQRLAANQANANQIRNNIYTRHDDNPSDDNAVSGLLLTQPLEQPAVCPTPPELPILQAMNGSSEAPLLDWEDHLDENIGCCCCSKSAEAIDITARWLFPAAFIVFNAIYWRLYGSYTAFGDWDNISENIGGNSSEPQVRYGVFFD
ncbi:glycine receptor subunit alphaZ1-like isoform X2 [Lineus longissimus]|uniref:glycine receptor subunit alphaZ1-like isoform X2 n=1 Tax=Lineus longissimus TaxID=88925 RepID=UPI002B4DEA5E